MKLGILADIHEDVPALTAAIALLRREAVDRVVVLGDLFDTGSDIAETVALLRAADAGGVWGNHELGLCHHPSDGVRSRYGDPVIDYMLSLSPRLEVADCLFTHALPCWDPTDPSIYYTGPRPETDEGRATSFAATPCRVAFIGHFHRWFAATPQQVLAWDGRAPLPLDAAQRYLVVIAAVCDGWCATYDTTAGLLTPWRLRADAR